MGSFLKTLKSRIRPDADEDDNPPAQADPEREPGRSTGDAGNASFQTPAAASDEYADDDLTEDMEPESVSSSGRQIVNGHLIVDGADMGAVDNSSISSINDVLAAASVAPTIHVPKDVFLPEDMEGIRFDGERDGFSKKQVAEFFEKAKASSEYLKKIIESRHDDIYSLAGYAKRLNEQIQDSKMMNEVARASGMAVIAGDDSNQVMELTEENQRLRAQLNAAQSGAGGEQPASVQTLQDQLAELKDRYSRIQDQLGHEQYTNKQLSDELSEMRLKLDTKSEQDGDDLDDLTSNITTMSETGNTSNRTSQRPQAKQRTQKPSHQPAQRQHPSASATVAASKPASASRKPKASLHPSQPTQKNTIQKRRPLSLKPSTGQEQKNGKPAAKQTQRPKQKLQLKHSMPASKPAQTPTPPPDQTPDPEDYISFE